MLAVHNDRFMKKRIIRIILGLAILLAVVFVGYFNFQESFLFSPQVLAPDYTFKFEVPHEELTLQTGNEGVISVVKLKADEPKGAIIYCHGSGGNNQSWGDIMAPITYFGYDIYVWDYRGFGKSTGSMSESILYADAAAVYDEVAKSYPADNIVLYGRSMGGAMACRLAAERGNKMLMLESPFYELADAGNTFIPGFPPSFLLRYELAAHKDIVKVETPIVIFHGSEDQVVPIESGYALYQEVKDKGARWVPVKGGKHNDLDTFQPFKNVRYEYLGK